MMWSFLSHVAWSAVWIFFVVFGNVMESKQMHSMDLVCGEDLLQQQLDGDISSSCNVYSEDGQCCIADEASSSHQNAYKIISVIGGTMASAQLALFANRAIHLVFRRIGGVMFVFHTLVKGTWFVIAFVGTTYVYQYLTYNVFFCHANQAACEHPATEYWVIRHLFYSVLALGVPYLVIQLCRFAALAVVFSLNREKALRAVLDMERMLKLFEADVEGTFSERVVDRYTDVHRFMRTWMKKNDEDIGEDLRRRAKSIMTFLTSSEADTTVSYDRFRKVLCENGITEDAQANEMWNAVVKYDVSYGAEEVPLCITEKGLQDMLYDLFFQRKELIHSIYTDHYAITFLARVSACIIYPATFIAVSRIFGYQNAFGTGVDLFKVYLLSASYLLNGFRENVMFMLSMLTDRPFNLGDVLLIGDDTYKVRRFSLTHVYLDGPNHLSVPIPCFCSENTVNLSKRGITDSLRLSVPSHVSSSDIDRDVIFGIMYDYQEANDRDVCRDSIRCGWVGVESGHKIMQCNWRYKFRIFDRSRLNWARADFRQFIVQRVEKVIGDAHFKLHIAGGGGYNDLNVVH